MVGGEFHAPGLRRLDLALKSGPNPKEIFQVFWEPGFFRSQNGEYDLAEMA
jgi:hypothetical protein